MKKLVCLQMLVFLTISNGHTQEMVQHFDTNSCEVVKRLDDKGGVYENTKIQNQEPLGTCYANTASMALLGFYNKENPDKKINQVSWLHLAFMTQKSHLSAINDSFYENDDTTARKLFVNGGRLCPLYEAVKGKKLCEISSDFFDEGSFKKNLESNPYTLLKVINQFENLLANDEFYQAMQDPNKKIISPNCIARLDRKMDKKLAKLVTPKLDHSLFEKLLPIKHPDMDINEFYQTLREKFLVDNFTKRSQGNNMLSAHTTMELEPYPHFSFNSFKAEDSQVMRKVFSPEVITSDMGFTVEALDRLYEVETEIKNRFQPVFNDLHASNKKELMECVNQTLNGVDEILITLGAEEGICRSSSISEKVVDTYSELITKGFNPDYIVDLLNSKNLYTRTSLFEEMMNNLYDNCDVQVPEDLTCDFVAKTDLPEDTTPSDLLFYGVMDQIDKQGTSAYAAFNWDFNRSDEEKKRYQTRINERVQELQKELLKTSDADTKKNLENQIKNLKDNSGTHAVSVLGYSQGCGEEKKRCVLIQNSYGDQFTDNSENYFSPSIIPDKEKVEKYGDEEFRIKSYGKFWLCDEDLINKNFESFARLRK